MKKRCSKYSDCSDISFEYDKREGTWIGFCNRQGHCEFRKKITKRKITMVRKKGRLSEYARGYWDGIVDGLDIVIRDSTKTRNKLRKERINTQRKRV